MITEHLLKDSALIKCLMLMNTKLKKLVVILTIAATVLSFTQANIKISFSGGIGGKIDLFTQKEPSDAFGPGEEVQIYALVTYNEEPVQNLLVTFEILGPKYPVNYRTVFTNETGIANITFRISHLNETTFGEWTVVGNTKIGDLTFQDSVTFEVGWIVEIVSIKTINENYREQETFTRGSYVGIELVLRNIAMTEKKITVAVAIYDCLNIFLDSTEEDFEAKPGNNTAPPLFLYIPKNASVSLEREAIVRACLYTVLCPEVSKPFFITNHDIAVLSVQPSPIVVYKGETVNIDVIVKNKGLEIESFNVSVYYNETIMGVSPVFDLRPGLNKKVSLTWNTSCVEEGLYRISAYVETVPGEIDTLDNVLTYDFVEVRAVLFLLAATLLFLSAMFISVATIIFIMLRTREKKKRGRMQGKPTPPEVKPCKEVGLKRSKTCSACGKEFPGVYSFCPYCLTFQGQEYG